MEYRLSDSTWDGREIAAAQAVLASGNFTMGERVGEYEAAFAAKFGVRHALMTSSGSTANLLAVAALVYSGRLKKGDEVVVPAVSWSTTYFPFAQMGLRLRFVDIDRDTLNIDIGRLADAITEKTRMVCLVNLLGNPNDFEKIRGICAGRGILIMEDNCESLGASFQGRMAGTFGLVGTFSTFYSHHLCTMEGGMAVTDDEELYHYMLSVRAHGWTRNLPKDSALHRRSGDSFYESFHFILPGFNLRPLEIEGAIGSEQLKKMDGLIARRRENAGHFRERMAQFRDVRIQKETGESSWFGFALILQGAAEGRRDAIVKKIMEAGIETRPIVTGNFTRNRAVQYLEHSVAGDLSASDDIHDNGFFIGNHGRDLTGEIDYFADVLRRAWEEAVP